MIDSKLYEVIAVGLNAVDVMIRMPETIRPDTKHMVEDLLIMGGAPVGTGSCAVATLGYATAFVGRLGDNTLSAISLEEFRKHGVDTSLVVRDADSRPAIALVQVDPVTAERTVFVNLDHYGFLQPADLPARHLRSARLVWMDSYDLDATEHAMNLLEGSPAHTLLDLESGDPARLLSLMRRATDVVIPLACAQLVSGESDPVAAVSALGKDLQAQVVITDGVNGSWGWTGRDVHHQPAYRIDTVVDTTGCGDAFHAGYAVGRLEGWPLPLRMELGTLLASVVLTRLGGRSALPTRADLPRLTRPETSADLTALIQTLPGAHP